MSTAVATRRLTAEQFERRFADVPFCELERGKVVPLTAGEFRHSRICCNVMYLIGSWEHATKQGRVLTGEFGLITERDPDSVRRIWERAECWEGWGQAAGPELMAFIGPLGALLKSTMRAAKWAARRPERDQRLRDLIQRLCRELDQLAKE